jgi:uncharacterized protein (TIGR02145 family)
MLKLFTMKNLKLITILLITLFAFSCKKDKTNNTDKPATYVLGPKSVIIDNPSSQVIQDVDSTTVIFNGNTTQLQNLTVGNIIISGIAPNAPYGFLRKITNIQKTGSTYTFTTVEVPLEEAFKELHVDYTKSFTTADTAKRVSSTSFVVELTDYVLYDADGNDNTTADQLKLNENIEVTPSFRFAVDISNFKLQYAIVEGNFQTIIDQSLTAGGTVGSLSKEVNIFEKPLAAYPLPGLPFLVVVPNLSVNLGAEANIDVSVTASQNITSDVKAYVEYKNQNWNKNFSQSLQTTYNFSGINGNASAKVYVEPAIDFKLYNSDWAKGSVTAQGYLKAAGSLLPTPDCELKAGLSAGIEANLQFFGWNFADVSYPEIFDYSKVLYTCNNASNPPVADFSASQTNINTGSSISFTDLSSNSPTSWSWTFQGGTPSTSTAQNPTVQYNTAGTYTVTLTATNANGNNTKTKTAYIVVTTLSNQIPILSTTAMSNIANNTASSGGTITSQGSSAVTARGVCWSTSPSPTIANSKTTDGTGTGSFTSALTGLTANTTYYVRAYATNSNGTAYGNQLVFLTTANTQLPTVATTNATNITNTQATTGGNVTNQGSSAVTVKGVCWSTTQNPTTANNKTVNGSGTGSYNTDIYPLTANTTYYVRAYATNSSGTAYGNQITITTTGGTTTNPYLNPNLTYGTVTDIDGNTYATIQIGTQTWMAENLKTTRYNDGTAIPTGLSNAAWGATTNGAYAIYDNNAANNTTYGKLYNWYAVNTGKLAPAGWHVPTDAEWTILINYLGGESIAGGKMKATILWQSPNTSGTNSSGFSALPAGQRYLSGAFDNIGIRGYFWSSSIGGGGYPNNIRLNYEFSNSFMEGAVDRNGLQIRCIKN